MKAASVPLVCLLLLPLAARAAETPKADAKTVSVVNQKAGFDAVRATVEPLVIELAREKHEEKRRALEDRLVTEFGKTGLEVLVRYREPHLIPVFARLTAAEEWYVRRLAVFALQRNAALSELPRIVALLRDENLLVREIAATSVAILHTIGKKHKEMIPRTAAEKDAVRGLGGRKKQDLDALRAALAAEENEYVKSSLVAAIEVMGKRPLLRIHEEQLTGEEPGRFVPRLVGGEVNSYQEGSGFAGAGSGKLRPTSGWGYPTILYPNEILTIGSDRPLVPLTEKANSLHFGHDCSWFLEGSSIYAIADGVVRLVQSGGDWGGLIVTEHMDADKTKVCGLNGHCGMWVFVKPGEAVKRGQVLGVMALSFSPENGGHGAHDHFGMFTGGFAEGMCYGRLGAGKSTEGWLVPPDFLTPKVAGEKLAPASYK